MKRSAAIIVVTDEELQQEEQIMCWKAPCSFRVVCFSVLTCTSHFVEVNNSMISWLIGSSVS